MFVRCHRVLRSLSGRSRVSVADAALAIGCADQSHPAFQGKGAWISVEVEDIDAERQRIQSPDVPIEMAIRDEPWGFGISWPSIPTVSASTW